MLMIYLTSGVIAFIATLIAIKDWIIYKIAGPGYVFMQKDVLTGKDCQHKSILLLDNEIYIIFDWEKPYSFSHICKVFPLQKARRAGIIEKSDLLLLIVEEKNEEYREKLKNLLKYMLNNNTKEEFIKKFLLKFIKKYKKVLDR